MRPLVTIGRLLNRQKPTNTARKPLKKHSKMNLGRCMPVKSSRRGAAAILTLDNPPVNALSIATGVVRDLTTAFHAALADETVDHILITATGAMFCGGADIKDFDREADAVEQIRTLMNAIETAPKPVVAAMHGHALGGGLELAIAAHYRIAHRDTEFAFPEVKLGLLPGGGGTQRLPRLIGVRHALQIMTDGDPISARQAAAWGLIDDEADGDVVAYALAFIADRPGLPPRRTGEQTIDAGKAESALADASTQRRGSVSKAAVDAIIACVEDAVRMPLDAGLAREAARFGELMASPGSQARRHAFFGERTVARIPGLSRDVAARPIAAVGIVGAGLMGTGIAIALLNADLPVILTDTRADALDNARAVITRTIHRDVDKGRLNAAAAEARIAGLTTAASLDALANADLVIEAVLETMEVKRSVFTALDRIVRPDAILASNTSTLDLDAIARDTAIPARVIGLHFFSPANIMRLLEVVRGAQTAPDVLASAMRFSRAIGKIGVVAGVCDGFIGNRMFEEYLRQAWFLLEEGALPAQIDRALEAWGMAMGPCRTMDLAGQDIGWSIRQRRALEAPDRPYSQIPDLICERGWFGQKAGRGFYRYADGRTAQVDAEVDAIIVAHSAKIGLERRAIADDEIVSRCVFALANEGARIVGEGIAYRPVDVDIVYLAGYGFPGDRGGPMFHADCVGLRAMLASIQDYARGRHGWAWAPAPLLVELASRDARFAELNR
jgi:3-hydroxyacyl-CoA dehydrogenase